jgi:hypothetical protein
MVTSKEDALKVHHQKMKCCWFMYRVEVFSCAIIRTDTADLVFSVLNIFLLKRSSRETLYKLPFLDVEFYCY